MDLLQREGKYPLPPDASKTIMGVEFAGIVTRLGEGAHSFKEGDEVFGLAYGVRIHLSNSLRLCSCVVQGAYAEFIVSAEDMLLHKPKEVGWVEAAGLPENWMTGGSLSDQEECKRSKYCS